MAVIPDPPCVSSYAMSSFCVPTGSPSRGGDAAVNIFDINQPSLPTLFLYSVLVSVSVFTINLVPGLGAKLISFVVVAVLNSFVQVGNQLPDRRFRIQ